MSARNLICVWYDGHTLPTATFYARPCADSAVTALHQAPGDYPA